MQPYNNYQQINQPINQQVNPNISQDGWMMITNNLAIYIQKPLGQGGFGTVYKGAYQNQEVAVKELKQYVDNGYTLNEYYQQEINTSQLIKKISQSSGCDYIVRVQEVVNTGQKCYVVMDLCFTDLQKLRKESPTQRLDPILALKCIKEISMGIKVLHDNQITHRDIKPDNIFLASFGQNQFICKVGDFGLGKKDEQLKSKVGTITYMAPDMLDLNNLQYGNKVDIWAIGVMTHELLTGVLLFQGQTIDQVRNNILSFKSYKEWYQRAINNIQNDFISQSFKFIQSEHIVNLIDQMLQRNPQQRKDINQIIELIQDCINKLSQPQQNNAYAYQNNQQNQQNQSITSSRPSNPPQSQIDQSQEKVKELTAKYKLLTERCNQAEEKKQQEEKKNKDLLEQIDYKNKLADIQKKIDEKRYEALKNFKNK